MRSQGNLQSASAFKPALSAQWRAGAHSDGSAPAQRVQRRAPNSSPHQLQQADKLAAQHAASHTVGVSKVTFGPKTCTPVQAPACCNTAGAQVGNPASQGEVEEAASSSCSPKLRAAKERLWAGWCQGHARGSTAPYAVALRWVFSSLASWQTAQGLRRGGGRQGV